MSSGRSPSRGRIYMQWALGILAIIASLGLLLHALAGYRGTSTTIDKGALPAADRPKAPPNPATIQYSSKAVNGPVFSQISTVDYQYETAAAKWLLYRFHKISVKGRHPGGISLQTLRIATGTTPLPSSLASAGVHPPSGTPASGSISLPNSARIPENAAVSGTEVASLLTTAGEVALQYESNNPLAVMADVDGILPVSAKSTLAQQTVAIHSQLMTHIAGVGHGIIPNAIHFYSTWATGTSTFSARWVHPPVVQGETIVAEIVLHNPFRVYGLASVNTGMTLAEVDVIPFQSLTLGLISQGGQDKWYVMGFQSYYGALSIKRTLVGSLTGGV